MQDGCCEEMRSSVPEEPRDVGQGYLKGGDGSHRISVHDRDKPAAVGSPNRAHAIISHLDKIRKAITDRTASSNT